MRSAVVLLVAVLFAGAGCATTDSSCRAPVGDRSITPAVAAADPAHVGERVTWGGTLVEARNLEDSTELEMIGYPLDACGRPRIDAGAVGRFIIVRGGYLETAQLRAGQPITATGAILATREGNVGDAYYRFPLLADPTPRVLPDERVSTGGARTRPRINVGVGAGSGWSGGGVGISF
jgi:outer membrane lipoprotein